MRVPAIRFLIVLLVLIGIPESLRTGAAHATPFPGTWQVLGAARTLPTLYRPMGLAADVHGNVFVADSGNFRIVKLGPHGQMLGHIGETDFTLGSSGTAT